MVYKLSAGLGVSVGLPWAFMDSSGLPVASYRLQPVRETVQAAVAEVL